MKNNPIRHITIGSFLNIPDVEPKELAEQSFVHQTDYKRKTVFVTGRGNRITYDKGKGLLYDGKKFKLPKVGRGRPPKGSEARVKINTIYVSRASYLCMEALEQIESKKGLRPGIDFGKGTFIDEALAARYPEHFKTKD